MENVKNENEKNQEKLMRKEIFLNNSTLIFCD